ncbi:hypothetical protein RN001_011004 [Aquatica leii]|uniref:NADP-dependent oxidoreductase domain-containing protein n=1 Tax=Aquatica leii TaxID=1421715 RepID=A0AAN7P8L5_9COLE|nr:hypothetical protein RN001_011004 [Aquatica leii]
MLKLNTGHQIPIIGLGTYKSDKGEVSQAVQDAIDVGYRHFDCAWFYHNESEVGVGIQAKIQDGTVKREDLFVVTKLWNNFHAKECVVPMLKQQLKSLQLDYIDLYLIHWPFGFKETSDSWPVDEGSAAYSDVDYLETWQGMEECVELGLARAIGISNFNSAQITRLLNAVKIKPSVNQIEVNPNINNKKIIQFCKEKGIVVTGYCPLGRVDCANDPDIPKPTIFDERVIAMAEKYKKTPAQIILRYLINLGITVIPKTVTKKRMIENLNVFDFDLEGEETDYIDSLNKNVRICSFSSFEDHKYFPFHLEY